MAHHHTLECILEWNVPHVSMMVHDERTGSSRKHEKLVNNYSKSFHQQSPRGRRISRHEWLVHNFSDVSALLVISFRYLQGTAAVADGVASMAHAMASTFPARCSHARVQLHLHD